MIAILLLGLIPIGQPATETVGYFEINHFYNEAALPVFTQVIFREPNGDIIAWRMFKSGMEPQRVGDRYRMLWQDGAVFRCVWGNSVNETFSQYDAELVEREFLPKEQRRKLIGE